MQWSTAAGRQRSRSPWTVHSVAVAPDPQQCMTGHPLTRARTLLAVWSLRPYFNSLARRASVLASNVASFCDAILFRAFIQLSTSRQALTGPGTSNTTTTLLTAALQTHYCYYPHIRHPYHTAVAA